MLVTEAARDGLEDSFSWSKAGKRKLKGVKDEVPLFRARRSNGSGDGDDD